MKTHQDSGISFSSEYLTEETVNLLVQIPNRPLPFNTDRLQKYFRDQVDVEEAAFHLAWEELLQDKEFSDWTKTKESTASLERKKFKKALHQSVKNQTEQQLTLALSSQLRVLDTEDSIIHSINEEQLLVIPKSLSTANKISTNAEATLYAIFIVIDVISVMAAVASITIHVNKSKMAKSLGGPLAKYIKVMMNTKTVQKLKQLEKAGKVVEIIQYVLGGLNATVDIKQVLKIFLASMSGWERFAAIVQLLGSILLLIGTAGASLAAKILQLGAATAILISDVVNYVQIQENNS